MLKLNHNKKTIFFKLFVSNANDYPFVISTYRLPVDVFSLLTCSLSTEPVLPHIFLYTKQNYE